MQQSHRRAIGVIRVLVVIIGAVPLLSSVASCGETLTLSETIDRALELAPGLAAATASSDLSAAVVRETHAPLYPNIFGTAEYIQTPGYDTRITNRGQSTGQLVLDYTAYDGGRRAAALRAAGYAAEAATLGVQAMRVQVVFDTTVAYFDLLHQRRAEKELTANLERLGRYVIVVEALERSGRAIPSDVLRIRSAHDSAELALTSANQAGQHASIVLGSMIGQFSRSDLQVADVFDLPPPPNGDIQQSPVLRASDSRLQSAHFGVEAAEAERYPTVKLELTSGFEGVDPPTTVRRYLGASYDGALNFPIFQGGLVQSHIDAAKAVERAVIAEQRRVKLELNRDLADVWTRYANARKQIDILERAQSTSDDTFALDWTRFLGGSSVTLLEVLDAYEQTENLRLARFDQEFAAQQANAQAALLLGLPR